MLGLALLLFCSLAAAFGGWASLIDAPGPRDGAILGSFYLPPTVSGTVGKRMLVLFGGNASMGPLTDVWFYDVGKIPSPLYQLPPTNNFFADFSSPIMETAGTSQPTTASRVPVWVRRGRLQLSEVICFWYI